MANIFDNFLENLNKPTIPNRFTIYVGNQIRMARNESNMSQVELAEKTYMRQAAISDIENGKREVSSSEILYLCVALKKPAAYFYPSRYKEFINPGSELNEDQEELLAIMLRLDEEDIERLLLIARAFHDNI